MIEDSALGRFTRTAAIASSQVIGQYSTSFGLATRLLGTRHRQHVRNIYAMVRVADEIVDGVAAEAGLTVDEQAAALDRYATDVYRAVAIGYASDLIIHSFARTSREAGIDEALIRPFFESMRADLSPAGSPSDPAAPHGFDDEAHARYVHGSAEVVGLMCLRVFVREEVLSPDERHALEHGARQLGAAFQNINFLRDLAEDTDRLGRSYLSAADRLDDAGRDAWVRTVRAELADAACAIPLLPADARAAVRSALALFAALTDRVSRTPAAELYRTRVRVPGRVKAGLAGRAVARTWMERRA